DEILLDEIRVDRVDERDVELDEVRLQVRDRAQSGVATPRVVDGEAKAALAERSQPLAKFRIVLDRGALGDLEDDAARVDRVQHAEAGIREIVWIDVEEEQLLALQQLLRTG